MAPGVSSGVHTTDTLKDQAKPFVHPPATSEYVLVDVSPSWKTIHKLTQALTAQVLDRQPRRPKLGRDHGKRSEGSH
jgi:hypothetical protein